MDNITNKPSHENPENGLDFYNHYRNLQSETAQKMQESHVMMGIRGLIQSDSTAQLILLKTRLSGKSLYSYTKTNH